MPVYHIEVYERHVATYEIEADTLTEAITNLTKGSIIDDEYVERERDIEINLEEVLSLSSDEIRKCKKELAELDIRGIRCIIIPEDG